MLLSLRLFFSSFCLNCITFFVLQLNWFNPPPSVPTQSTPLRSSKSESILLLLKPSFSCVYRIKRSLSRSYRHKPLPWAPTHILFSRSFNITQALFPTRLNKSRGSFLYCL